MPETSAALPTFPLPASPCASDDLQRALREQQSLLDSAAVGIVFIRQRSIVRCNQRLADIFQLGSSADAIGRSSQLLHPNREVFHALVRDALPLLLKGQSWRGEHQMRRSDGALFWAHLTGRLVNTQDSREGSVWTVDDIDDQQRVRAMLATFERENQLLFEHALAGIVFLRNHRLTRCNRHFEDMLGYGQGELLGASSRAWFPSDRHWQQAGRQCYPVLQQGGSFEGRLKLRAKDGRTLVCLVRSKALDAGDPSLGSIWIIVDVTGQHQSQAQLRQLHARLQQQFDERTHELNQTVQSLQHQIRNRQQDREHIYHLAHYDALTQLPNRTLLAERSHEAIARAAAGGGSVAVMFLDLDNFKHINDSLGHATGDALLVEIARRLRQTVRGYDTVARLGGDEFVLLLPGASEQGAARVAEKVQHMLRQPFSIDRNELNVALSMGIALYPQHGSDFAALLQCADTAMYHAKATGRDDFRTFTPQMQRQASRALQLESALRKALERGQLSLHYQPQITLDNGKVSCVEALLRWHHPQLGDITPSEFIPIAENSGQILSIGEWVIRSALAQLRRWHDLGLTWLRVAVNLSALQFRQPRFPQLIEQLLQECRIAPDMLELELTEGVAIDNPHQAVATMRQLHAQGVRMSVDDFGTGYSSLNQLKRFQIYKLKIDQSFVRDLDNDGNDRALVSAIIRMAQALGIRTTAEGVESQAQLDYLREQGCCEVQGYLFSAAQPADVIQAFLLQHAA
ncbi:hypothetical protein GCM10022279_19370 [Comamonas faecalis]|uniref:EAL domain-containing protein n=1 Tax=Comamonas faecalis TaxID=1387849 RepID=A0ABP7RDC4_9BURK